MEDDKSLHNLYKVIESLEGTSGININLQKSELLGINMDPSAIGAIAIEFSCKTGQGPSSYLSLPLNGSPKTLAFWTPVLEKIEKDYQLGGGGPHLNPSDSIEPPHLLTITF